MATRARILADYVSGGATAAEFDYLDGVTSSIQTQLDAKSPTTGHASIATLGTVTSVTISTGTVMDDPTMTQGSDATGDVYYRAAGGALTRLATGADGTVLTSTGVGAVPAFEAAAGGGAWTEIGSGNIVNNATADAGDDGVTWATDHDYDLIKAYVWNLTISESNYNGYFIPRIASAWEDSDLNYLGNRYHSSATTRTTVSNTSSSYVYALPEMKTDKPCSMEFTISGGNLDTYTPIHWQGYFNGWDGGARYIHGTVIYTGGTGKVTGFRFWGASGRTISSTNEYIVLGANT